MKLSIAFIFSVAIMVIGATSANAWTQADCDAWFQSHHTVHPDCVGRPTPSPSKDRDDSSPRPSTPTPKVTPPVEKTIAPTIKTPMPITIPNLPNTSTN